MSCAFTLRLAEKHVLAVQLAMNGVKVW